MPRAAQAALILIVLCAGLFYFREHVRTFALQAYFEIAPCTVPITYSIASVDPRFDISTSSLSNALARAAGLWNSAAEKDLFQEVEKGGSVKIHLHFDDRQATTEALQDLGSTVDATESTYDYVKAQYETAYATYRAQVARFEARYEAYESSVLAYERDVRRWNARGGAPSAAYAEMEARQNALEQESATLRSMQAELRAEAEAVNAFVKRLNEIATALNISVAAYNTVGESFGGEFEEALYESRPGLQTITVFEFGSMEELTRVLAHELGHALGLEHVEEEGAIMYRLNQGEPRLAQADISALDRLCRAH